MAYLNKEIDELVVRLVRRSLANALGPDAFGELKAPAPAAPAPEPEKKEDDDACDSSNWCNSNWCGNNASWNCYRGCSSWGGSWSF
jgi:hypothetical protein